MGGSSKTQTSSIDQTTKTNPWDPTIPTLNSLINQLNPLVDNAGNVSPTVNGAFDTLNANAARGNPYASGINNLAANLLNGGGANNYGGYTTQGLGQLQSTLTPIANQSTNPYDNPAFLNLKNTLTNDITDQVKSAYAGAGYSPVSSGDFAQQLGRGISQGVAPTFLQAQDQLTNQATNAANSLYQGGAATSGILSGLNQTALGNMLQGVGTSTDALNANDSAALRQIQLAQMQNQYPLSNIGSLESLIVPMAQLGGTNRTNGTQTTQMNNDPGVLGTLMGIGSLFAGGAGSAFSGMGGPGLLGWFGTKLGGA